MRKAFASNLILLLAINAIIKPLYLFGIDMGVQNTVGTAEYGRYATWFSFAFLFGIIYDLGLQNYNAVTLSKQPLLLRERLPTMLSLKLVLALVYFLVVLTCAFASETNPRGLILVALACTYHASLSLLQLLRTNLGAQEKYAFNSIISVIDKLLLVIGIGALLLNPAWTSLITIESFFIAQILAIAVTIVIAVAGTEIPANQRWLGWDSQAVKTLLKESLPYGLILLLSTAFTRVDIVMLKSLAIDGFYQAGVYAAAYRLLDGVNMVGFMFASLLIPMMSKLVGDQQVVAPLIRQAAGYMLALGIGVAAYTSFFAQPLLDVLYAESTPAWGEVLQVLMWAAVSIGSTYIYGSYLLAKQRITAINITFTVALGLNLLLNWMLIPNYGPVGAAWATIITQGLVAGTELWLSKTPGEQHSQRALSLATIVYVTGCLAANYGLLQLQLSIFLSLTLSIGFCALWGIVSGLIDHPKHLLKLKFNAK